MCQNHSTDKLVDQRMRF